MEKIIGELGELLPKGRQRQQYSYFSHPMLTHDIVFLDSFVASLNISPSVNEA